MNEPINDKWLKLVVSAFYFAERHIERINSKKYVLNWRKFIFVYFFIETEGKLNQCPVFFSLSAMWIIWFNHFMSKAISKNIQTYERKTVCFIKWKLKMSVMNFAESDHQFMKIFMFLETFNVIADHS